MGPVMSEYFLLPDSHFPRTALINIITHKCQRDILDRTESWLRPYAVC